MSPTPIRLALLCSTLLLLAGCGDKPCTADKDCGSETACAGGKSCLVCEAEKCVLATKPELSAPSLPNAFVGEPYNQQLSPHGGALPYAFTLSGVSNELSWLHIDSENGFVTGKPTTETGTPKEFVVTVRDRVGQETRVSIALTVLACHEGDTVTCFVADASTCRMGKARCTANKPGPCTTEGPSTDGQHCGVSGTSCASCESSGNRCTNGHCACGTGSACADGTACCGAGDAAHCIDVRNDRNNCGVCGNICPGEGTAAGICVNGICSVGASCPAGFGACDPSQPATCGTPLTTFEHCGSCAPCVAGSADTCSTGTCKCGDGPACTAGQTCCAGPGGIARCTDPKSDANNCGQCGQVAPAPINGNGSAVCSNGQPGIVCAAGFNQCNRGSGPGCYSQADWQTCGGGQCSTGISTPTGNAIPNTTSSHSLCCNPGTPFNCGTECAPGVNTASCVSGVKCVAGFGNCDTALPNGCEVNLTTGNTIPTPPAGGVSNCAACGNTCNPASYAHVQEMGCDGGGCTIKTCLAGWDDCNDDPSDGCEADLSSNGYCGSCNNPCAAGADCEGGACNDCPACGHTKHCCTDCVPSKLAPPICQ